MKLLQKAGRYYLLFSALIFIVGGGLMWLAILFIINFEADERLRDAKKVLQIQLTQMDSLPSIKVVSDNVIEIDRIAQYYTYENFVDTLHWNPLESEYEPYRKYSYHDKIRGEPYRIALNHSKLDDEELMFTMMLIALSIFGLLLIIINVFNRFISLQLWQPFYHIIQQIKGFSLENPQSLTAPQTNIEEFSILHHAIQRMSSKIVGDYRLLKQFAENASSEIQAPLAVIKDKVEDLRQHNGRQDRNPVAVNQIQEAATRLSTLNQSLLLLTRIENRQFTDTKEVNLKQLIINKLNLLEPLILTKNLTIQRELSDQLLSIDPALAEVLLNNLLGNAIKHNIQDGSISITLKENHLAIRNTGPNLEVPPEELFERFRKATDSALSQGLGLAIVRQVCFTYSYNIKYEYEEGWHEINLYF